MDKRIGKLTGGRLAAGLFLAGLALWCAACPAEGESRLSGPSRERLLKLLDERNAYLRAYAVYNVACRLPEDVPKLARFISDGEPLVRRAAIFSLGLIHFEQETEGFLKALADSNYGVRRAAVFALGNMKSARATERIRRAVKDNDPMVRQLAALALARAGDKQSVPGLTSLLGDESPRVRRAAAVALGMLGEKSALGPLKRLYRNRKRSEPPEQMVLTNERVREALGKKLNLDYKFLHFAETLDKLSEASGVEIRVDDEVLFMLNASAKEPENLKSIRLAMWSVPFEKALEKIVETVGAYYYVESGTINISSTKYRAYDTPVALEVAGAMALLGDRSGLAEVRNFLKNTRYRERAREILRAVTGR